jgi:hypothetical protein
MQLIPLTADKEKQLFGLLEMDYCDYYFFIYDYLLQKAKTKIFFAQDNDAVRGLMVQYDGHIAQLRGDEVTVRFMRDNWHLNLRMFRCPKNAKGCFSRNFPKRS